MINQTDLMNVVDKYRGDAVVIPTMSGARGWYDVSTLPSRDLPIAGAMGKASSIALGLALARPEEKVIVFDADGSLLMNLGTLATIAGKAPRNLYHFVMENGVYAITGGQPIPAQSKLCFAGLAREAGYAASYEFDDLEDFATRAEGILNEPGPVFICVKTVPEIQNEPIARRVRRGRRTSDALLELRQALGTL